MYEEIEFLAGKVYAHILSGWLMHILITCGAGLIGY
jgi:hypothetical protein